mgnify:CR=1 FL=1
MNDRKTLIENYKKQLSEDAQKELKDHSEIIKAFLKKSYYFLNLSLINL